MTTINADSHILVRLVRQLNQNEFVQRYGDTGEDEFDGRGGTIPQRLLLMNGELVRDRIKDDPFDRPDADRLAGPGRPDRRWRRRTWPS